MYKRQDTPVPTLFIWGPDDPVSGAHMLERIHERCTAASVVELPGVGHWPSLEAPEQVAAALRAFLDAIGA